MRTYSFSSLIPHFVPKFLIPTRHDNVYRWSPKYRTANRLIPDILMNTTLYWFRCHSLADPTLLIPDLSCFIPDPTYLVMTVISVVLEFIYSRRTWTFTSVLYRAHVRTKNWGFGALWNFYLSQTQRPCKKRIQLLQNRILCLIHARYIKIKIQPSLMHIVITFCRLCWRNFLIMAFFMETN